MILYSNCISYKDLYLNVTIRSSALEFYFQICFEIYTMDGRVPKLLSCGHTFCHQCIMSLNNDHIRARKCPTCRIPFFFLSESNFATNYSLLG
ncbi:unnamed protein product [Dracunculus medinensis]|uniref:RING-type domain-containing protein n=1 Tax=Dracunculus medinensis TaxID=318479 RepID=A0A0N4UMG2_DRAME|nr:unnamed protein product [Dracunculus medinensis]